MFGNRPLLWLACAWIAGMAVAAACMPVWIAAGSAAAFVSGWAAGGGAGRRRSLIAAVLLAAAFTAGAGRFEWAEALNRTELELHGETAAAVITGTIASSPEIDGDRVVFDIDVRSVDFPDRESVRFGRGGERMKAYVYLEAPEERASAGRWKRGDEAALTGEVKRPSVATNFGGFDYRKFLERRGMFWIVQAEGAAMVEMLPAGRWSLHRAMSAVDSARQFLSAKIEALYPEPAAGFMKGLLVGVGKEVDPEQYRTFSQIGLTHILAISGLHVGLFVGALLWLLARFPIARETRMLIAMLSVPAYVLLTGASPSAVRAGLMAVIALYAARRRLLKDGLHILAAAAVLMLAYQPFYLYDVGFQLSFAVTAGLIALVPPCMEKLAVIRPKALRSALAVTLVAQLVSFPLTITYFNQFHLLSFPANFALVPLFSIAVLPLGSISLLLSFLADAPAKFAAYCAERVAAAGFAAADWLAQFHAASTIWATPPLWWVAAYYALLGAGLYAYAGRIRFVPAKYAGAFTAGCAVCGAALMGYAYAPDALDRDGLVAVLDVGQGDAIYVRTPAGKRLLIDAGGTTRFHKEGDEWRSRKDPFEVGRDVVVPLLMRRGVHSLDMLFATHNDTDHIGGAKAVLRQVPVRRLFFNGTASDGEAAVDMFRAALERNVPVTPLSVGDTIIVDEETKIEVLHPAQSGGLRVERNQNGASLVLLMTMRGRTFLFTGDIGAAEEKRIASGAAGHSTAEPVDVLKVAHHGSKSATGDEWLRVWRPKAAVVSAGRNNRYGHPHPSVEERLMRHDAKLYRTDLDGEVQFRVGGGGILVRTRLRG